MDGALWERFWAQVDRGGDDDCWPWRGPVNNHGYGHLRVVRGGRKEYAHRVAFVLSGGELMVGAQVLHSCDNPPCVNPRHLRMGDPMANSLDKRARGRSNRGERHGHAKLTSADVLVIRAAYASGGVTQRELADRYDVSQSQISYVVTGRTWGHVE